jgi:anti-anti-sigma regulatory factor
VTEAEDDHPFDPTGPTRLTVSEAATVRADVLTVALPGSTVALPLASVRDVDTCGLGLLLDLHRTLRTRGARFVCLDPSPSLLTAMRRLGIHRIVAIERGIPPDDCGQPGHSPAQWQQVGTIVHPDEMCAH